jgi:geranylgeranyl diphosphate synthase type I
MPRTYDEDWLTDVCNVDAPLKVDQRVIEDAIIDPIWSMMDRGGKGWRSTYLMICCHALSEKDVDIRVRDFLPVVEMLHTGSLIIDDIQDGSLLRRSQPALHTQIGEALAINVGNFLYFLPLIIIRKAQWLSEAQRLAIYDHVTVALRQGHIGQALDLAYAKGRDELADKLTRFKQTRDELTEQYRLKTGSQMEAVARIAGVITQAPQHLIDAIAEYSRVFGVVFQIIDDLIDIQEGRERLGKHEGEDIRNSKLNMVLLHALSSLADADRERLIQMIGDANDRDACLQIGEIIQETPAIDECIAFSEGMVDTAWRGLDRLPLTDSKVILRSVPKWLLNQRKMRRAESIRGTSKGTRG